MNRKDITEMKIRTYTNPAREVGDGFTCDGCGAVRKEAIGKGHWCADFRRELIVTAGGTVIKCFECTFACRSKLIAEGVGGN